MRGYSKTIKAFEEASSAIEGIIALGKKYKEEGMQAVKQGLLIQNGIDERLIRINCRIEVYLRILPGYAMRCNVHCSVFFEGGQLSFIAY